MNRDDEAVVRTITEHCAAVLRELRALPRDDVFESLAVPLTTVQGHNTNSRTVDLIRPRSSPAVGNLEITTFRQRARLVREALQSIGLSDVLNAQDGVLADEWGDTTAWRLLDRVVFRSLEAGGVNANRRTAEKIVRTMIGQIRTGEAEAEMLVALPSLGWTTTTSLSERVSIRELRAGEIHNLLVSHSGPWPGTVPTHGLVVSVRQSLGDGFNFQSHWPKVIQALLALRLAGLDPGVPFGAVMQYVGPSVGPRSEGASTWRHGIDPPTPLPLSGVTPSRLRKAKTIFGRLETNPELVDSVPSERFLLLFERRSVLDRLVDLWVGIEALLMGENETSELTYKVANRAAVMLRLRGPDRIEIRDRFTDSYRDRSKLVHGRRPRTGFQERTSSMVLLFAELLETAIASGALPKPKELDDRLLA